MAVKFIQFVTLTNQTIAIYARRPGQILIVGTKQYVSSGASEVLVAYGTGAVYLSSGDWDLVGIVAGNKAGMFPFDGSNPPADIPGAVVAWDGTVNASTSTMVVPAIDRVVIERNAGGQWERVRGGDLRTVGGAVRISDLEMPLHSTVTYRILGYAAGILIRALTKSISTETHHCQTYIKTAADPNATVRIDWPRDEYARVAETQGGTYDILGGEPLAVGQAQGQSSDRFTLLALTKDAKTTAALADLLKKSQIFLVQPCEHEPYPAGWYFAESVTTRMRADGQVREGRSWTIPVVRVGMPSGDTAGVAGTSYRVVQAKFDTYADLLANTASYFDLSRGV
ncbi:hypothetical protein [Timonella senegalensis]|uniref:hypothetical protein n=1 Tax=Timonella senegalensis TaxID=1465825 RepID=UPI002FDD3C00